MKGVPLNEELYQYIIDTFVEEDEALKSVVENTKKKNFPLIQISPENGKFLFMLAKMVHSKNILEIGTLTGYSTIWLARALPEDGKVTTLEISSEHAAEAKMNFDRAGVKNKIHLILGDAFESLDKLSNEKFDFVFIDANKERSSDYFDKVIERMNKGGIIATDNTLRDGDVVKQNVDAGTKGIQMYNKKVANDQRVDSLLIPISDGVTLSFVK